MFVVCSSVFFRKRYGQKPCMGSKWGQFINYDRANKRAIAFGSGIKKMCSLPGQATIGVFSATSTIESTLAIIAGNLFSWPVLGVFDQFNADSVVHVCREGNVWVMLVSTIYTAFIMDVCKRIPKLKYLVQLEELRPGQREKASALGITLLSFAEVEQSGFDFSLDPELPESDDLCQICVSAGTTEALPKVVKFTHEQVLAQVSSATVGFWMMHASWDEVFMSFNSLAFSWERILQECMFITGSAIGFPAGSAGGILEDICAIKPTFIAAIPQFFAFFSARVSAGLAEYGFTTRNLFFQALESKKASLREDGLSYTSTLYDGVFFAPVRELLGGRLRVAMVLGDYIDALALEFLRVTLCVPIICGYHTTETGLVTATHRGDVKPGSLGAPLPGCEIKLCEVGSLDVTGEYGEPGEISVRWSTDKEWVKTGDIGFWDNRGALHFVDRIQYSKLVDKKLYNFGRLSNLYGRNQWVRQIFVFRDKLSGELAAVVVPDLFELTNYAANLQASFEDMVSTTDPTALLRHAGFGGKREEKRCFTISLYFFRNS